MVYELRCYTLTPGKMPEYLKAAETIGRPARGQNFGINHGYWTAEFGALNQIWHLWKYDSYEERSRLRGELAKNKAWTEGYVPVIRPLIQRQDLRLMNPVVDILPDDGTTGNVYELRRPAIRRELQEGPSRPRQVLEDLGRLDRRVPAAQRMDPPLALQEP